MSAETRPISAAKAKKRPETEEMDIHGLDLPGSSEEIRLLLQEGTLSGYSDYLDPGTEALLRIVTRPVDKVVMRVMNRIINRPKTT